MQPRNSRIVTTTLSFLFIIHVIAFDTSRAAVVQDEIVVTEGTAVKVITTAEITSRNAKPNDPVGFTVVEDVVINGQVVVRTGTEAIGSVVNAEKGGYMGKSGNAIDMGPGRKYFFRIGIEAGMWKGQGKITLDDAERAITEIKKLKFLDQDKIKASTIVVELPPN